VIETKSPESAWLPGSTNTHTSTPGKGPPPWSALQSCVNASAVVGTLPLLIEITVSAAGTRAGPDAVPATDWLHQTTPPTSTARAGATNTAARARRAPRTKGHLIMRITIPSENYQRFVTFSYPS
jgi:hypothetical protein